MIFNWRSTTKNLPSLVNNQQAFMVSDISTALDETYPPGEVSAKTETK